MRARRRPRAARGADGLQHRTPGVYVGERVVADRRRSAVGPIGNLCYVVRVRQMSDDEPPRSTQTSFGRTAARWVSRLMTVLLLVACRL